MERAVVLIRGRRPDDSESRLIEALKSQKVATRVVQVRSDRTSETEFCTVAYSQHADLLEKYDNAELISSKSGGAKGVVPNGFPALPDGYALHRAGPAYWKLIDPDGVQVGSAKLKKDMIPFIAETL